MQSAFTANSTTATCARMSVNPLRPVALLNAQSSTKSTASTPFERNTSIRRNTLSITAHTPRTTSFITYASGKPIDALIFDCDGVIVESEDIHREAYNAAFAQFDIKCPNNTDVVVWTEQFYDMLQNKVGGGKPKMRWYFGENGWPTSSLLNGKTPSNDEEKDLLIDTLQDWKTNKYKEIIGSGQVKPRDGILELMDAAQSAGVPVAVCSASTKAAVSFVLPNLLGKERFEGLDLFMAGDDVPLKKPDPTIYKVAAERLNVDPSRCIVIEDSVIGLAAALGAGMKCVITYTNSTAAQEFKGALAVLSTMGNVTFDALANGKYDNVDDRVSEKVVA